MPRRNRSHNQRMQWKRKVQKKTEERYERLRKQAREEIEQEKKSPQSTLYREE